MCSLLYACIPCQISKSKVTIDQSDGMKSDWFTIHVNSKQFAGIIENWFCLVFMHFFLLIAYVVRTSPVLPRIFVGCPCSLKYLFTTASIAASQFVVFSMFVFLSTFWEFMFCRGHMNTHRCVHKQFIQCHLFLCVSHVAGHIMSGIIHHWSSVTYCQSQVTKFIVSH